MAQLHSLFKVKMYDEAGEVVDNALFIDDYYDPDLQDELQYYYENSGPEEDVDMYDFVEGENFFETGEWILVPKEQTSA